MNIVLGFILGLLQASSGAVRALQWQVLKRDSRIWIASHDLQVALASTERWVVDREVFGERGPVQLSPSDLPDLSLLARCDPYL